MLRNCYARPDARAAAAYLPRRVPAILTFEILGDSTRGLARRADARNSGPIPAVLALLATATMVAGSGPCSAQEPSPRTTRAVEIIRRIEPGVVAVYSENAAGRISEYGSGAAIGDGYVITNYHVVKGYEGVVLFQGQPPKRYSLLGRMPEKDLALLRTSSDRPIAAIPLGRSDDLMAGEPILAGGNPGGRGIVFSSGIISSPSIIFGGNALAVANSPKDARDRFIQIDAAINRGNSGGPLVNAEGMMIGVVSRKVFDEDNTGYAIPIDLVRDGFRGLAAPEEREDIWTGVTVDVRASEARVARIDPGGPGERAGVREGDRVVALDGRPVRDGIGWLLALFGHKAGDSMSLAIDGPAGRREVVMKLDAYPAAETVARDGKVRGLRYTVHHGELATLADLPRLGTAGRGTTDGLDLAKLEGARAENYAVAFDGYLEIPEAGVYQLILGSDDGSRLFLDGRMIIDCDGAHPVQESRSVRRLARGLHRMHLEYFQGGFQAALGLRLERDVMPPGEAPVPLQFFRD